MCPSMQGFGGFQRRLWNWRHPWLGEGCRINEGRSCEWRPWGSSLLAPFEERPLLLRWASQLCPTPGPSAWGLSGRPGVGTLKDQVPKLSV